MNPKYILVASAAALFQISVSTAGAASVYWDGANGAWDLASNWSTVSGATTPDPLIPPTTGDTAVFSGGTTVSLNGATAIDGVTFSGSGTLSIADNGANQTLSIGAGGITAGAGTAAVIVGNTSGKTVSVSLMADQTWAFNGANNSASNGIFVRHDVSLGVSGNHTLTLGGSSGSTSISEIRGAIGNGLGTLNITLNGVDNNRWNFTADSTYTGVTTISKGALGIVTANGLGSTDGNTTVASGASLFLRPAANTAYAAEPLSLSGTGAGGRGALRHLTGNTSTWFGAITANTATGKVRIGADNGTLTLAMAASITTTGSNDLEFETTGTINVNGAISGPAGLAKIGGSTQGLLNLVGNSTYTGATRVDIGVLSLSGTLANTASVTVASGAFLRGTGTINQAALTTVNGTIGAGANTNQIGTLSLGGLTVGATGALSIDINTTVPNIDRLNVAGDLTLSLANTAALSLNDIAVGSPLAIGTTFTLIDYTGIWNGGLLSFGGNAIEDEIETFYFGNNAYTINYDGGVNGNDVQLLVVVPEPASAAFLLGGFGLLAIRSRRRR